MKYKGTLSTFEIQFYSFQDTVGKWYDGDERT